MVNIIIVIIVAAVVVLTVMRIRKGGGCSCGCGCGSGSCGTLPKESADTVYPASSSLSLDITGMHCEKCSGSVSQALNALDGVSAEVDLQNNSASVKLSKEISAAALKSAVSDKGFEVTRIRIV